MQHASSRTVNRVNPDGSYNVYCWQCHEFIAASFTPMQRALCVLCQRAELGEPLDEEFIRTYKASKALHPQSAVSTLYLPPEQDLTAAGIPKKKFSFSSLAGDIMAAVGQFALRTPKKPDEKSKASQISKQKRRPRLFSGVSLGDMEAVDKNLKKKE